MQAFVWDDYYNTGISVVDDQVIVRRKRLPAAGGLSNPRFPDHGSPVEPEGENLRRRKPRMIASHINGCGPTEAGPQSLRI